MKYGLVFFKFVFFTIEAKIGLNHVCLHEM